MKPRSRVTICTRHPLVVLVVLVLILVLVLVLVMVLVQVLVVLVVLIVQEMQWIGWQRCLRNS